MKWETLPLASLGTVQTGSTPSTTEARFWEGEVPFVTPSELDQRFPITLTPRTLTEDGSREGRILQEGAVMVCCIGSLGKIGIAGRALVTNQQINSIEFDTKRIYPKYGYYACQRLKPKLISMAPATTVPIVNKSKFGQLEIPVPPLPEQIRIASILDQADALRVKRIETLAQLDSLTQAIFIEMFGDPVTNPRGWKQENLEHFFQFRTGKLDSNAAVVNGAYPFFTCAKEDAQIDTFAFDCEALLLAGNNATADYSVKHYKGKFNAYQRTYVITLKNEANAYQYAAFFLENHLLELKRMSKGSGTKYLTLALLNKIRIPVPPVELQRQFATRLSKLNKIRAMFNTSLFELDNLFASLQSRAFHGEL